MKLTGILLMMVVLQVSASTYGQKITLKVKKAAIQDIFLDIQQQSGYDFVYSSQLIKLAKPITLSVKDASINEVIEKCLVDQPFAYIINRKTVTLIEKPAPKAEPVVVAPVAIAISGRITDEKGESIPGVSVIEKGTTPVNGITSNASGNYTLNVAGPNAVLVFSFIGFESKQVTVGTQTTINVQLNSIVSGLNEVVVVGYGTQKKVSVTGAVSSITGAQLITTRNESVLNMLTGKLPGVRVVQNTAEPGAFNNSFDIRGLGSPLFVIDGVPRTGIERLDPNDVESISVLKDAAAAVYGVQAGNGVVLVTTKKGKAGTSQITYSVTYGVQHASGLLESLNATDYMTAINEKTRRNNGPSNPGGAVPYQPANFADFAPGGTKTSTNWVDETVRRTAGQAQHNLNLSGGSEKSTYFISLGYLKQDGFLKTNDENYNKYNIRSNISSQVAKGLTVNLGLYYMADQRNYPSFDFQEVLNSDYRNPPIFPAYVGDPGGHLNYFGDNGNNAVLYSNSDIAGYRVNNKKLLQSTLDMTYEIPFVRGLKAKGLYSYNNNFDDNKTYRKQVELYTAFTNTDGSTGYRQSQVINGPSSVNRSYNASPNTLMQFSLNFTRTFAQDHNIDVLALYEETGAQSDGFNGTRYIAIGTLDQLAAGGNVGQSLQTVGGGYPSNSATKRLLARARYDYRGKYLIEASIVRDGSSRFAPSKKYGVFPAVSAGWRLSEESFIKKNPSLSFISNLKVRGSYGLTGDAGQVNYQFISGYDYPFGGSAASRPGGAIFDGAYISGVGFRTLPNFDVSWTRNKMLNIGIDADLWNGGLGITADYFVRNKEGILATRLGTISGSLGASLPQENLNSDQTSGFEIEITHRGRIGSKLNYNVGGNASYARTKNIHVERAVAGNSYDNWVNNMNNRYGDVPSPSNSSSFQTGNGGRFTSFNEIYSSTVNYGGGNRNTLPGDYKYIDWNNDGTFSNSAGSQGDASPLALKSGNIPLVNFGLTIGFQYGNFDLDALAQGAAGKWIAYNDASRTPLQFNGNEFAYFFDRWHPVNPNADMFDPHTEYVPGFYSTSGTNPDENSMYNYQNASYIRLKSASIGYSLPGNLTRKIGVKRFRIYFSGYNLFTITGLRYYDPEHPNSNRSNEYPLAKTYNIGANITF